jgi:hypothetical protein
VASAVRHPGGGGTVAGPTARVGSPELGLQLLQGDGRLYSMDALGEKALTDARRRVLARLRRGGRAGAAAHGWGAWRQRRHTARARTCTHGARLDCGLSDDDACLHGEVCPVAGKGMLWLRVEGDANNKQTRKKGQKKLTMVKFAEYEAGYDGSAACAQGHHDA